jgi:hypothetical protein
MFIVYVCLLPLVSYTEFSLPVISPFSSINIEFVLIFPVESSIIVVFSIVISSSYIISVVLPSSLLITSDEPLKAIDILLIILI